MKIISLFLAIIYYIFAAFGWSYGENDIIYTPQCSFTIEAKTDVFYPSDEVWVNGSEYPTIICLSHNEDNNGKLLSTFEVFDKGNTKFRIMESDDKGNSWKEISIVTETLNPELQAAWEPCLFELPKDIGNFKEGTIILGEISLDDGCKSKTQLSIFASTDCGKSWKEISIVDEAGGTGDGIWEPWFVYEDGYVYCFYSDDSDPVYSQTIVYKRSSDLINWSDKVPVVVNKNTLDRPGMPVITKMGNGKYYLCYELLSDGNNKPCRYKISDSISEWDINDEGTEIIANCNRELHTSPVCLWIPEGGKNGTLIVTAEYQNKGNNELFISYDYGKTYSTIATPFRYTNKNGYGYSPAMIYSENDNCIYYMNTVDYKDALTKIQFVRMKTNGGLI